MVSLELELKRDCSSHTRSSSNGNGIIRRIGMRRMRNGERRNGLRRRRHVNEADEKQPFLRVSLI